RIAEELESLGTFATATWRPPQQLFDEPDEHKLEWLRAFIRDEGYFDETNNRLRIKSMNKTGLTSIKELLATLDVPSKVTGPNSDDSYYLTVSRLNNFKDLESIAKSKKKVRK
ncbi:MAG: LAGLIDADG family homing endonuclease, partial [Candidatus Nanohaloarchaea archaeon]|nr:LAGLIDADG family homing endonuclease [Candidatus Nanohaloarchaea archaeon]